MHVNHHGEAFMKKFMLSRRNLLGVLAASPIVTWASTYPQKPIRLIVPFGAGGITDLVARVTAEQLGTQLKQTMLVDNRPGAGGNIAAAALLQAPADGYTLMFATLGLLTVNPHIYEKVPFDPLSSFTYLSTVASTPSVIVVHPSVKVANLQEVVAEAKKNPEGLRVGTAGVGSAPHQGLEIFQRAANIKMLHVPFKSGAESVNALLAGHIDMTFEALPIVMPHVKAGKAKALALAAKQRQASEPSIMTTAEAGFPTVISGSVSGLVAPAGLPADIQGRLREAIKAVSAKPEFKGRLFAQGTAVMESAEIDYQSLVRSEFDRWAGILKPGGK
jgi:tripartite-type tricarboxylate transporter receptor subunit TctC